MSAAAALSTLRGDGLTLALGPDGRLVVGPAGRLTADHRALIRAYRPALVDLLTPAPAPDPEQDPPCRAWLIRHPDGSRASHTFTPPATLSEIRSWYPGAVVEEDSASLGHGRGSFPRESPEDFRTPGFR